MLIEFMSQLPPCLIGMEACGGAHFWGRLFTSMGHEVKLISPQFVKPYVKSNKNDANDAEGIHEALTRPNMRFVAIKTVEQQSTLLIHRARELAVKQRSSQAHQIRGMLLEYGVCIPKGRRHIHRLAELEQPCNLCIKKRIKKACGYKNCWHVLDLIKPQWPLRISMRV